MNIKHFLQFNDFEKSEIEWIFNKSKIIKDKF
jgi:ornithine carbamoyltransferase